MLVDPTGMESEGWIEQNIAGKKSYTYDSKINTIEEAKAAGYEGVTNVHSSLTLSKESTLGFGGYSYDLNTDGSVTDNSDNSKIFNSFTTGEGTKINALQGTFLIQKTTSMTEDWANSDNILSKISYGFVNSIYLAI